MLYSVLLYVHIFSVIVSIGPYFVLLPMLAKMRAEPFETLQVYWASFTFTVKLTKHAGHVLIATGIALAWLGGWSWRTPWIAATALVLLASLLFLARAFSPLLRKLRAPHDNRTELVNKLRRALLVYLFVLLLMMWFMVAKPSFGL
ncbi:hypothetical protein SD70_14390 [Gordoniibacillus kamchatkensis]|uniref:DUF2269 domain-containing protein n=1 Tax=Gordoniibacillus kamchatkensis TaxID=1590651 RepID=A0ABR5AHH9_9BACL|nr:DUF2269 family protein [Paenibacillus sp. VKM B-2647]KIL40283.1 hypothetical protein SD70_14390 [Paenibacillus sp. VKM B-2647]